MTHLPASTSFRRTLSGLSLTALLLTAAWPVAAWAQAAPAVEAGEFDNGRMWTFDVPPVEYFAEEYDFTPSDAWFEKARMGALRLPNCTASFVSPMGLVMTNHHCSRDAVADVTQQGETLLSDAERAAVRSEAIAAEQARIESALTEEQADNHIVQIISLDSGGRYSAYTFRRFPDLRLVMAPELNLGYFGGDTDNFTYPRYALDMTFFRVYVDDKPYEPEHYFAWSADGAAENEPVFVVGNPGSTLRLETVSQLEWRRDVQEKALLELLNSRIAILEESYKAEPSNALLNMVFGLKNAQKLYDGRVRGLNNPDIMTRR